VKDEDEGDDFAPGSSNGSGTATNSATRPDASTTISVMPATFSGGFWPLTTL
jgi:hypothetical protein